MKKIVLSSWKKSIFTVAMALSLTVISPVSSFANPADAVPPSPDGTAYVGEMPNANKVREPDDNKINLSEEDKLRDEKGIVSQLSTNTHNPYNGQIRLDIDVGSEFAKFKGSNFTEGLRIKVSPGGIVDLPKVEPRDGYYFVGWSQGGVAEEPTWDIFTEQVEMETDTSDGKNTTIFALYTDDEGNGYCTCGSYEQGIYKNKLEQIKADNDKYLKQNKGQVFGSFDISEIIGLACLIVLCIIGLILAALKDRKDGLNGDTEYL